MVLALVSCEIQRHLPQNRDRNESVRSSPVSPVVWLDGSASSRKTQERLFSKTTNPSSSQGTASSHSASSSSSHSRRPDLSSGARWSRLSRPVCVPQRGGHLRGPAPRLLPGEPTRGLALLSDAPTPSRGFHSLRAVPGRAEQPLLGLAHHPQLPAGPWSQQYPMELRFYYYIDITADQQRGFQQVHRTVLHYLEELCQVDSSKLSSPSSVDTEAGLSEEGHRTTHSELSSTDSG
ncbi:toll/interleukin-1 receptor domain-containing adapter protein-like [Acipenser oxyrinchus oxyrinchus]|uniref:Toll/interleukin-1 receptor domain-containing adapter protein-like n=1 Tax=Acipenser oxyrinchus oxyrinchus TaxID=40147 RepID=A0AAD8FTK9_ACIOX|nr:toll/interleukin-1 receptor domain-containing adapter protein-like [Acipenser oxyrinchus oxyrinchus]